MLLLFAFIFLIRQGESYLATAKFLLSHVEPVSSPQ